MSRDFDGIDSRLQNRLRRRDRKRDRRPAHESGPSVPDANSDIDTVGGVVVEVGTGACEVVLPDDHVLACRIHPDLTRRSSMGLAVGDDVVVGRTTEDSGIVRRVSPRRSALVRSAPGNQHQERIVVANVDWVGIVCSATDPPLRPRLIDRLLIAVQRSGARPVVIVTKLDLAGSTRRRELDVQLEPYEALGHPVLRCSATTGTGLEALREVLAGSRCAFVGHSGVGKSSLVHALGGAAAVGGLAGHGRGRHTTSSSSLQRLPGGLQLIDTPGVRQFALWKLTRRALVDAFEEFAEHAPGCAYRDCRHEHAQGCGVHAAADAGDISWARLDSYLRLLAQLPE